MSDTHDDLDPDEKGFATVGVEQREEPICKHQQSPASVVLRAVTVEDLDRRPTKYGKWCDQDDEREHVYAGLQRCGTLCCLEVHREIIYKFAVSVNEYVSVEGS